MALFTEALLKKRVSDQMSKGGIGENTLQKANRILFETNEFQKTDAAKLKTYDIFLSHCTTDLELVAGLILLLEDLGYSVYVDWIDDPRLNRTSVTRETALLLQQRMRQSKSLIYAFSENSNMSKWMPWELGYFDGIKQTAAVLPISKSDRSDFKGTEYLSIYFYIQIANSTSTNKPNLWVYDTATKYTSFDSWIKGTQPFKR
jgi:TIR domain